MIVERLARNGTYVVIYIGHDLGKEDTCTIKLPQFTMFLPCSIQA